jgi:uncharacterized protein YegP (UPF0339 family)
MYFYLFQEPNGQWRWNYRSDNHKIIADSAEGYHNKQDALSGIGLVKSGAAAAPIYDNETKTWL